MLENVKGYFRRGKCQTAIGNFDEAKADFAKVLKISPGMKKEVEKELEDVVMKEKEKNREDQEKFKKLFSAA